MDQSSLQRYTLNNLRGQLAVSTLSQYFDLATSMLPWGPVTAIDSDDDEVAVKPLAILIKEASDSEASKESHRYKSPCKRAAVIYHDAGDFTVYYLYMKERRSPKPEFSLEVYISRSGVTVEIDDADLIAATIWAAFPAVMEKALIMSPVQFIIAPTRYDTFIEVLMANAPLAIQLTEDGFTSADTQSPNFAMLKQLVDASRAGVLEGPVGNHLNTSHGGDVRELIYTGADGKLSLLVLSRVGMHRNYQLIHYSGMEGGIEIVYDNFKIVAMLKQYVGFGFAKEAELFKNRQSQVESVRQMIMESNAECVRNLPKDPYGK